MEGQGLTTRGSVSAISRVVLRGLAAATIHDGRSAGQREAARPAFP